MQLAEIRKIALALPEAVEAPHFHRTSFRVRGKIFATAEPGKPFLNVMLGDLARERALAMHSDCIEKLHWGSKVVGVTVDLQGADAALVADLLGDAWAQKAPKSVVAAARANQ